MISCSLTCLKDLSNGQDVHVLGFRVRGALAAIPSDLGVVHSCTFWFLRCWASGCLVCKVLLLHSFIDELCMNCIFS